MNYFQERRKREGYAKCFLLKLFCNEKEMYYFPERRRCEENA